ncbi:GNAT family protein [Prosthecomicrobium sp. N25]|uniref:GNAT family protein n=1 Tax=Prosthecomicrobium sp. N25 TaxID=3129254 RepID=UPI003077374F
MSGYFGTEAQQRLQALAEQRNDIISATPGACQTARFMSCDDLDRFGWDRIEAYLDQDGICGFRLLPADRAEELRSRLAARNFRLDTWNVFLADRDAALAASEPIVARGLPAGLVDLARPTDPEGEYTSRIQGLMASVGVMPFSGSFLVGALVPAITSVVGTEDGEVVATAHGSMGHNAESRYARYAWGGLAAVEPSRRGTGLGTLINARMVHSVFHELGATHVHEFVSASNIPSRRMVEACGLRHTPELVSGIAVPNESARFTR